jgi:hypothetical protein
VILHAFVSNLTLNAKTRCGGTSSIGADELVSHPSPAAYPPYIPPPERPHPSAIYIRDVTIIEGSENCRRFRASVGVRDGIIASVKRTNESERGSTLVASKQGDGIKRSYVEGAKVPLSDQEPHQRRPNECWRSMVPI